MTTSREVITSLARSLGRRPRLCGGRSDRISSILSGQARSSSKRSPSSPSISTSTSIPTKVKANQNCPSYPRSTVCPLRPHVIDSFKIPIKDPDHSQPIMIHLLHLLRTASIPLDSASRSLPPKLGSLFFGPEAGSVVEGLRDIQSRWASGRLRQVELEALLDVAAGFEH